MAPTRWTLFLIVLIWAAACVSTAIFLVSDLANTRTKWYRRSLILGGMLAASFGFVALGNQPPAYGLALVLALLIRWVVRSTTFCTICGYPFVLDETTCPICGAEPG